MRCPKCNYVSHDYLETCRKCSVNLAVFKQRIGLFVLKPGILDLSAVLGSQADHSPFANRLEGADARVGVDDFDISLDDYADRPVMRRAPGTFIRPGMQQEGGDLQHLTLQLDASAMSTELPRHIVRPPAESSRAPGNQGPPTLPPINLPEGTTDLPPGHLTLDLGATANPVNLVSGAPSQLLGGGSARPAQPLRRERPRRTDEDTAETPLVESSTLDMDTIPPPDTSGGPLRVSGLLSENVDMEADSSVDLAIPLLDSTTDDSRRLQRGDTLAWRESTGQPRGGKQAEEQEAMPTLELSLDDAFDIDPSIMDPAERHDRLPRREPSSDSLDLSVEGKEITEDAFDIVERLENSESTRPGPGEILPSGTTPRAGLGTTRSIQSLPDTSASFRPGDMLEEDLAFEFQGAVTNTDDDAGLLDDENPFQFDLDEMDLDADPDNRNQGTQHESMPGRLTLELDTGAMSMELPSTSMGNPVASNINETERRSVDPRLDMGGTTDSPLADAVFTSLADTFELDDTPKAAQSGHLTLELDANAISAQLPPGTRRPTEAGSGPAGAPAAPALQGQQSQDDEDEIVLDLDDLDDTPRPSRS